jgi:hypothetical protein
MRERAIAFSALLLVLADGCASSARRWGVTEAPARKTDVYVEFMGKDSVRFLEIVDRDGTRVLDYVTAPRGMTRAQMEEQLAARHVAGRSIFVVHGLVGDLGDLRGYFQKLGFSKVTIRSLRNIGPEWTEDE